MKTESRPRGCLSSCSYIKPQPSRGPERPRTCCLSSCSYIKPQPPLVNFFRAIGCLSSCSYIKPQPVTWVEVNETRCLSSCSYIKPQQFDGLGYQAVVVYHLVPTSNHNTSLSVGVETSLFIILFLHQTTTYSYKSAGNQQDTSF